MPDVMPQPMHLPPQSPIDRTIAVGLSFVALLACVIVLVRTTPIAPRTHSKLPTELAALNDELLVESTLENSLQSFIDANPDRLSNVLAKHWFGMCGSRHFFRFNYSIDADINRIITGNSFSNSEPSGRPVETAQSQSELPKAYWGMGIPKGAFGSHVASNTWPPYAPDWYSVPPPAETYYRKTAMGWEYLHVDKSARVGYFEVAAGMP
ncbi:MAG: hypothetical protein WBH50_02490 [Fuerstiella sp.]